MTSHHKTNLRLDWCSHEAAKYAVEHWHYSRVMPAGKSVKVGVWERDKFKGVVVFSLGANSTLGSPYGLSQTQCCELTRVAMTNHETPVTRVVAIAMKMLCKAAPGLRLVVSFADPEQGHRGGIYQGGGWLYAGKSHAADEYIVHGKRMHGRSMRAKYGTHMGKPWITKMLGSSKHRYLMPLDDEMRSRILPLALPYPKRASEASSDAPAIHAGEGGAAPTLTLQQEGDINAA